MRSIVETLKSNINESVKQVAMAFCHDAPDITYFFINPDPEGLKKLEDEDFMYDIIKNPKNIISFQHSDEDPEISNVANSESEMKSLTMKEIKDHIKGLREGDEIDGLYPTMGGFCEWKDEKYDGASPEDIYKRIINNIEQSYIDGDSSWVWGVVDISKKKTIVSGDVYVNFIDDFEEWFNK